jgi:polyisoprenoid-binding protein YceI
MSTQYKLDESHTHAQFSVRHMMVSNVRGEFTKVSGEAVIDDQNLDRSKVNVTIDAASISSRDERRDSHLKSADFFDVANFPTLTFASKAVRKNGSALEVVGDLTIRGVTREVSLSVDELTGEITDPWGNARRGARASTTIDRKDFGLVWNTQLDKGGVAVGDKVAITLEAEFVRAQA